MVGNIASAGKRVMGAIIDILVLIPLWYAFAYFFGEVNPAGGGEEGIGLSVSGAPAAVMFLIGILYLTVMEATTGKTIGKYVARTRVVDEAGEQISWGKSIERNLMRIVDGFFFYLVGFVAILASKNNQRLGDIVCKTYVVTD